MEIRTCICGCNKTFECKNNSIRSYITGHFCKGKTYEEKYGKEKADKIKEKLSKKQKGKVSKLKGITYEERFGKEKAEKIKKKLSKKFKGISFKERFGKKKSHEISKKLTKWTKKLIIQSNL